MSFLVIPSILGNIGLYFVANLILLIIAPSIYPERINSRTSSGTSYNNCSICKNSIPHFIYTIISIIFKLLYILTHNFIDTLSAVSYK